MCATYKLKMFCFKSILTILICITSTTLFAQQKTIKDLLADLKKSKPDTSQLSILSDLSSAYMSVDPKLTFKYSNELKFKAAELHNFKKVADADILIGISWGIRSHYDSALHYFKISLKESADINYEIGIADAYINIGEVYRRLGDDVQAANYYLKALPLFEHNKYNHGINLCLNNLGEIYQTKKSYQLALNYFNTALKNYQQSNDISGQGFMLNSIGACYFKMGNYERSLPYLEHSLAIRKKLGEQTGIANLFADIAAIKTATKSYDQADKYLNQAFTLSKKINDNEFLAQVYEQYADNYLQQNKLALAKIYSIKSMVIAREIKSQSKIADALKTLSTVYAAMGDSSKAYKYQTEFLSYRDSMYNEDKLKIIALSSLEKTQADNIILHKQNLLNTTQISKNKLKIKFYGIVFALSMVIILLTTRQIIVLRRSNSHKKLTNELLKKQKNEILEINSELHSLNEELTTQMEVISLQNEELEKLNAVKNKLYSVISHDFRSPLSTLKNLMDLNKSGYISADDLQQYFNDVSLTVDHTFIFLDNLLNWAKNQMDGLSIHPQAFNIETVIEENIALFNTQASLKNISIINNATCTICAYADPDMIKLIVRNLLANAIKFSRDNDSVEISAETADKEITIAIKDTGIGMDQKDANQIFGSGHTTLGTANEKGTGLGLIMCHEFVTFNKGKIWVESKKNEGTTFYFTVPLANKIENVPSCN